VLLRQAFFKLGNLAIDFGFEMSEAAHGLSREHEFKFARKVIYLLLHRVEPPVDGFEPLLADVDTYPLSADCSRRRASLSTAPYIVVGSWRRNSKSAGISIFETRVARC